MEYHKTVDAYISNNQKWKQSLVVLREIMLETELEETVKWGSPVYTVEQKNVVGLAAFKTHVGLWFYQGVFLSDPNQKLINAQEGVTKALRQWRFSTEEEIISNVDTIKVYLQEAINNQKDGKMLKVKKTKPLIIPIELQEVLSGNTDLNIAFENFSLYKKREFADYISEAKRVSTKQKRLKKIIPMISDGIGLGDKYRK